MSKHAIDKSGDSPEKEVITVSSTLPPAKRGYDSGRFNRFSIRDSVKDPKQLLSPSIGGTLLRESLAWELLPPEIKRLIQPEMLDFIAKDPIPESKTIDAEIHIRAGIAYKQIGVRRALSEYGRLPELIAAAIYQQMESEIQENPELTPDRIIAETLTLADEAVKKIAEKPFTRDEASGRYCLIAHDVLEQRKKRQASFVTREPEEESPDSDDGRITIPDAPEAIKHHGRE